MAILLISNLALVTAFLFVIHQLFRRQNIGLGTGARRKLLIGGLHGLFGIVLMLFSVQIGPTTMLDFRQLMIVSAASYGGPISSLSTALVVIAGRVLFFGGLTESALMAGMSSLLLGIGSGLIFRFVRTHWRSWILSILLADTLLTGTLVYLLGSRSSDYWPTMVALVSLGGLFIAAMTAYFSSANKLERELVESEKRYRHLHSHLDAIVRATSGISIIAADLNGKTTLFNPGAERMLGYRAEEFIDRPMPMFIHSDEEIRERAAELEAEFGRKFEGLDVFTTYAKLGKTDEREWTYIRKDGSTLTVLLNMTAVKDVDNEIIGFMGVAVDITERKRAERTLRELSLLDGLTGVSNHRHFDVLLEQEWGKAQRSGTPLALIMFDIDYFKKYNDTYGHQAGDDCLKGVAATVAGCLKRKGDTLARYGGEEFGVILPNADASYAAGLANEIRAAVEARRFVHEASDVSPYVTISVGVASVVPDGERGPGSLVALADSALYHAKQAGRNRVKTEAKPLSASAAADRGAFI